MKRSSNQRTAHGSRLALLGLLAFGMIGATAAQEFPARPIRVVIPFPAGGSIDIVARAVTHHWGATLGQQMVIDNRGGAGGLVGTQTVMHAAPDGYTVLY